MEFTINRGRPRTVASSRSWPQCPARRPFEEILMSHFRTRQESAPVSEPGKNWFASPLALVLLGGGGVLLFLCLGGAFLFLIALASTPQNGPSADNIPAQNMPPMANPPQGVPVQPGVPLQQNAGQPA